MDDFQEKAITKSYAMLRKSLDPGVVAAELVSEGIITMENLSSIHSQRLREKKNELIIQFVRSCSKSDTFQRFLTAIRNADPNLAYIAQELEKKYEDVKMAPVQETQSNSPKEVPAKLVDHPSLLVKPTSLHLHHYISKKMTLPQNLQSFSLYLGLEQHDIDAVISDNPGNIRQQAMDAIKIWHQGRGKPRTWKTVLDGLEFADMRDYAAELRNDIVRDNLIK